MNKIKHLLDVVDKVRDHVALGLMSDPGLSKTAQVKQWAEDNGREYCELIISQRMPSEISGMPMPIQEDRTMGIFDFDTLLHLKDGDVLAFDEFTNGNIQTLNACLTLIQERTMLSGRKLPSLVIVAMGNPQGRCDLLPQTKQRFWWVDVLWHEKTWTAYIQNTWGFTPDMEVLSLIASQYSSGFSDIHKFNYFTPRTVENMFRMALVTTPDDPIWKASNVNPQIVRAVYRSLTNKDQTRLVMDEMIAYLRDNHGEEDITDALNEIMGCHGLRDLKRLVLKWESEGEYGWLIEHLMETMEPGGADE